MAETNKNMTFDVNLLPISSGDHNLGSSNLKWRINGVADPKLTDTTNLASMTGILPISLGGTGGADVGSAKVNLGLQSEGQAVSITQPTGSGQIFQLLANVSNSNSDYNNKRIALILQDDLIRLYNVTDSQNIWQFHYPDIVRKINEDFTVAPEVNYVYNLVTVTDSADNNRSSLVELRRTDGSYSIGLISKKDLNHQNQFHVGIDQSGNAVYEISSPTALKTALSLNNVTNDAQIAKSVFTGKYQLMYSSAANTPTVLNANTSTTKKFLTMIGTGTEGYPPTWSTIDAADVPNFSASKITSGTLGVARGGTGAESFTANSLIMSGSTTTAALTTRAITNNTSNTAITNSNTNIPTMNTIYYGLATINNASQSRATGIYAPTSAGTANQLLVSAGGTSAPTWLATASGAAYATSANGALTFGALPIAQGGTGATSGFDAATNLGLLHKTKWQTNPTSVNDTSLMGHGFITASNCTGLPTSTTNTWYHTLCIGSLQLAFKFGQNNTGFTEFWVREYINNRWVPWKGCELSMGIL